eukprot:RCo011441
MGGKGRKSNKMFITAKEWSAEWGGAKPVAEENSLFTRLRFDCCSLSFQPMKDPVAAPDGTCFERSNILEYLDQHGTHPRTGEPLRISDLFALKFHCNTSGLLFSFIHSRHRSNLASPFGERACFTSIMR